MPNPEDACQKMKNIEQINSLFMNFNVSFWFLFAKNYYYKCNFIYKNYPDSMN